MSAPSMEPLESRQLLSAVLPHDIRINFQPADDVPAPDGYVADTGARFGRRGDGLRFGWNVDHAATAVRRNSPTSPDERFDTFNTIGGRAAAHGHRTVQWSIALPNGKYLVDVAAGDPDAIDASYGLRVQNVVAIQGTPNDSAHWIEQSVVVAVTHGRLSVSAAANSFHNKIDFITIKHVANKTPTTTGVPLTDDLGPRNTSPHRTAAATSTAPANDYNFNGATHNAQNIALNKSNVPLYDSAGQPLGLYINNTASGTVQFQGMEAITVGGKTYYYEWGAGGQYGQSGHVHIADMVSRPTIDPNARGGSGGLMNGRSAPDIILSDGTKKSYYVDPVAIPSDMHYTGPSDGLQHSFSHYGTPASPYSSNNTPLTWSWVNKTGGGITRIQMLRDEVFYPSDVATINITSTDSAGVSNGSVKAMYGSIWNGEQRIFGWTVHSHIYQGVYTAHIRLLNG